MRFDTNETNMNHRRAPAQSTAWIRPFAAAFFGGAIAACAQTYDRDYFSGDASIERLRELVPVSIADQSRTEPITVEQGAINVLELAMEVPAPASTVTLTLADVRAAALANNLDLAVEVLNPEIAAQIVNEEEAKFEATFFGSARRSVTDSPVVLGTESSQSLFNAYDVGIRAPLSTGGSVEVSMPFDDIETDNPFSLLNPAYEADLRFSLSQPLLRGAWDRATTHSIRVARYQRSIADARTRLEAIRILANADRAYWLFYAALRELDVRRQQYALAVTQRDQARRRIEAGNLAQIELTRSESGIAERVEAIIIAHTAVRRRERDLKRILNRDDLPMDGPTAIIPATDASPLGLDLDPEALASLAIANRMEMLELELQLAIDASSIDFHKNAALPLVMLDYTYTINGLGSSYGDAFDQLPDHSFEDWALGLRAEVPIGNEAAKARVNGAILTRLQRLATKDLRTAAIRQEVFDALDQLLQNWQRILAARQEAILAGRTYAAEQRQFDVGLRTSTDVLDAAARLADAQSNEIAALTGYQIAQIDIAFATGTLLGHDRVVWEPPAIELD